jgi:hypothetical protein
VKYVLLFVCFGIGVALAISTILDFTTAYTYTLMACLLHCSCWASFCCLESLRDCRLPRRLYNRPAPFLPHYCAYQLAIQKRDLASSIAAIVGARRRRPAFCRVGRPGLLTRRELITGRQWPWPWLCEPVKTVMLPCYRSGGRARISIGAFLFELLRFHLLHLLLRTSPASAAPPAPPAAPSDQALHHGPSSYERSAFRSDCKRVIWASGHVGGASSEQRRRSRQIGSSQHFWRSCYVS